MYNIEHKEDYYAVAEGQRDQIINNHSASTVPEFVVKSSHICSQDLS